MIFFYLFFKKIFIYLFIYFWLPWVFVAVRGLSPVVASRSYSSLRCAGLSLWWPLLLRSMGSRCTGFSSCGKSAQQLWHKGFVASWQQRCGISPDQGSNPCPLHWQSDSQPLNHQGSPLLSLQVSGMSISGPFQLMGLIMYWTLRFLDLWALK